jgi:hypothetical protein
MIKTQSARATVVANLRSKQKSQRAVADKDSDSCLKLRFSNHQILKTIGDSKSLAV